MIMKKILILLSLFISSVSFAQSNLPPCSGDYWNECNGERAFSNGEKFLGDWKNNKKDGYGILYFTNGSKFMGAFVNDQPNGFGTWYYPGGEIRQQGIWVDGRFIKPQSKPNINPQDIKHQKCIGLGLSPGSVDFQQCVN